jgi:hypothetical protein
MHDPLPEPAVDLDPSLDVLRRVVLAPASRYPSYEHQAAQVEVARRDLDVRLQIEANVQVSPWQEPAMVGVYLLLPVHCLTTHLEEELL